MPHRIRALVGALAVLVAAGGVALGQGSQHALRFFGGGPGHDRLTLPIDDDVPGAASAPADVGAASFTIGFWIKGLLAENATSNGGGDREYAAQNWKAGNVVLDRSLPGGGAEFGVAIAGGFVRFGTGRGASAPLDAEHTLEGGVNVLDGTWHHVAVTRDAASGVKRIFVDAMLDFESAPGASKADLSYPDAGGALAPTLTVAAAAQPGAPAFTGTIDELRFHSKALTASLLLGSYDRTLAPGAPALVGDYRFEEGAGTAAADSSAAHGPSATVVAGVPGDGEWTSFAADAKSAAPIGFALLPPGFQRTVLTEALDQPTSLEFAPDGRLFIGERQGAIKLWQNGQLQAAPVIQVAVDTTNGERGIMGLACDPAFASNGWLYVFYTSSAPAPPVPSGPRDRVGRFTVAGGSASPSSEVVIWQNAHPASDYHHGGGIGFGADGKLYLTVGDQLNSANAQDPSVFDGKLLRLNADGSVPADNPFVANPSFRPEIFALGLRNPFRFAVDPQSGAMWIGDVGGNTIAASEEVDRVAPGANFGWPLQEGDACYAAGCAGMTFPAWSYRHDDPDDFLLYPQGSLTMGPVYRATQFPSEYRGNLFVADYANRWIRRLVLAPDGAVIADPIFLATGLARTPVDLAVGPDGALYYLSFGLPYGGLPDTPSLLRIDYVGTQNLAPVVLASAAGAAGSAPLQVQFSSAGTFDPDAGPGALAYTWSFGDGQTSSAPSPSHVYASDGVYTAFLTASDGKAAAQSEALTVAVGHPPQATLLSPLDGATYQAGQTVQLQGFATDVDDGPLPGSALRFDVFLIHHEHAHPFFSAAGASASFVVPSSGHPPDDTHLEVRLTATDSDGLESSAIASIHPATSALAIATLPQGIAVELDGEPLATPAIAGSMVGFEHALAAPAVAIVGGVPHAFQCWSDGGAASHAVIAPKGGLNLTAMYQPQSAASLDVAVAAANRNAQFQTASGQLLASASDAATLRIGRDPAGGVETGFEFALLLPPGATILSARLRLTATDAGNGQPQVAIHAYDVASAAAFVAGSATPLVQWAPLTAASIGWTLPTFVPGQAYDSADLAPLLQHVVDRTDFAAGNAVGLVLDGTAETLPHWRGVANAQSATPPRLVVSYLAPGAPSGACDPPCGYSTYGPMLKAADRLALVGAGSTRIGQTMLLSASGLGSASGGWLLLSFQALQTNYYGGTLLVSPVGYVATLFLPAQDGGFQLPLPIPGMPALIGVALHAQVAALDPAQVFGAAFSNGLKAVFCAP